MKKTISALLFAYFGLQLVKSQTIENSGKPVAEIFTDFHYYFEDTASITTTGFGLNRAYLGYNFLPDNNFSASLIVNVGPPEDLNQGTNPKRYVYFREASLSYTKDNLKLTFGITGTHIYDFQQKFWGKRYLENTYQSLNGYGYVADMGFVADYRINDVFKADISFMNGEGYPSVQLDNSIKASAGITITPGRILSFRLYGDILRIDNLWQSTLVGFAGIKNELITFGAEISYKSNLDLVEGHHAWGISSTGAIKFSEKGEFFARYDHSASVVLPGSSLQWNYLNDSDFIITGIQFTLSNNVQIAFNYRGKYPYFPDKQISDALFINAHFKF
jgi:hypothetical protein